MKKFAFVLAIIIILATPVATYAAVQELDILPDLVFNGTTATCEVAVAADNFDDHVSVTMKLWKGTKCLATWSDDGYGYVFMSEPAAVTKGQTYQLTVDVKVNGVSKPRVTIDGTC